VERQRRRDDLLEALFWLSGEGLAQAPSAETLAPLVVVPADEVRRELRVLAEAGWVERAADGTFRLTVEGRQEAGRRFADSFADVAGRQGHGACDDDCDCHTSAAAAEQCAEERHVGHSHGMP